MLKTSSTPPPSYGEQQAAAPGLRFPGKRNQERGGQLLRSGLENTPRSREGNARTHILTSYSIFADCPAVFLHRKAEMFATEQVAV